MAVVVTYEAANKLNGKSIIHLSSHGANIKLTSVC